MECEKAVVGAIIAAVSRGLVQGHDIWEGHLPEIIKAHCDVLQAACQRLYLTIAQGKDMRNAAFGSQIDLVGVAREIGYKSDHMLVFVENAPAISLLSRDNILEQSMISMLEMLLRGEQLLFDGFEDKIRGIDLAMRVRVRDTHNLAFILEGQHMPDLWPRAQVARLLLPDADNLDNCLVRHLSYRQTMIGAKADHAS